jgi:hypothetical protein
VHWELKLKSNSPNIEMVIGVKEEVPNRALTKERRERKIRKRKFK